MAECLVLTMGGKDGVPPRFPRPVAALVAIGTAAMTIGLTAAPASADQTRQQEWWLGALSISNCWTASQGSGVTVAVLSDGVDGSHPDLTGVVTAAPAKAVTGAPVATGQFFGAEGTPIASLIAGHGDGTGNASGILGVAPEARILSVPVTLPPDDPQLNQTSVGATIPDSIAAGIRYAVSQGATVIDLPIDPGQPGSTGSVSNGTGSAGPGAGGSAAEQSAVSYALQHNVVLVAPAGDDAATTGAPNYPAAYQGVIAVGAFNSALVKAPWTSRLSYVTLTAAGAGVIAASNNGGYETVNSTSAASAIVAGIVALIRSRYPNLSVAQVRTALTTTTMFHRANGLTDGSGYGAVNAAAALTAAATLATPASERAGADAEPPASVRPPASGAGVAQLSPQIVRAGEISGGVLVLLLLAVAGYGVARRRRRTGGLPALAAEWTAGQAQSRYPRSAATVGEADPVLEYFAGPGVPSPESGGQLATTSGAVTAAPVAMSGDTEEALSELPAAAGDADRWAPYGPATSPIAKRAPVAGAPPWEPASPPKGTLPWSEIPAEQTPSDQGVASGSPAGEPDAANPVVRSRRRPDRRRAIMSAIEQTSSIRRKPDDPARRMSPQASSRASGPADRQAATSGIDLAAPAAWRDSAGTGSPADRDPEATPSRHASTDIPDSSLGASGGQHRSGLPIRQPRSVTQPRLSPSGALWEADPGGSSLWDRSEQIPDAGSPGTPSEDDRPIFVWEPPGLAPDGETRRQTD